MLNPLLFQWLVRIWGPHTIDRFASPGNAQLNRFNSRFYSPGAEAVDAFTCSWTEDNNWWVPPVHLVPRVIRHAQNTKSQGTLVIPKWLSSPFWPLLFPDGSGPAEFVAAWIELPLYDELILPGILGSSLFKSTPNTAMIAMRLEFQCTV